MNFLFWRDQNRHSNLTSKIAKMCKPILKNIAGRITETTRSRTLPIPTDSMYILHNYEQNLKTITGKITLDN